MGRRRRGAAGAGGPRGGEWGAGTPRAVGARRQAALMTNTLGLPGHRAALLPRERERPAGAPRAAAEPARRGRALTK